MICLLVDLSSYYCLWYQFFTPVAHGVNVHDLKETDDNLGQSKSCGVVFFLDVPFDACMSLCVQVS